MTIRCPACNEPFVRSHPKRRFCSDGCRQRDRRARLRGESGVPVMGPLVCPGCSATFDPVRTWQKYCSGLCHRKAKNARRVRKERKRRPAKPCAYCATPFVPRSHGTVYCTPTCRARGMRARSIAGGHRRLHCHHCRGKHISANCPNLERGVVKQYGTTGRNGEYVPPPGVKVRVRHLPPNVFGEDLKAQAGGRFGR